MPYVMYVANTGNGSQAGESMPTAIASARLSAAILPEDNVPMKEVREDLGILISS